MKINLILTVVVVSFVFGCGNSKEEIVKAPKKTVIKKNLNITKTAIKQDFKINIDYSTTPDLKEWCEKIDALLNSWYPKLCLILKSDGFTPPKNILIRMINDDKGVAAACGTGIVVHAGWVRKHPKDLGLAVHEIVHVIQSYPNPKPWWITEGIADYVRWGLYEKKPLSWFPVPKNEKDYQQGYRMTAGFLLWLDKDASSGLITKINKAMRNSCYKDDIFKDITGKSLAKLWQEYSSLRQKQK